MMHFEKPERLGLERTSIMLLKQLASGCRRRRLMLMTGTMSGALGIGLHGAGSYLLEPEALYAVVGALPHSHVRAQAVYGDESGVADGVAWAAQRRLQLV